MSLVDKNRFRKTYVNLKISKRFIKTYPDVIAPRALGAQPWGDTDPPVISSLNYSQGDIAGGGQSITITGENLNSTSSVKFGLTSATIISKSHSSVTVTLPAHVAGTVDVSVTTDVATATSSNAFEFWSPAQLSPKAWARAPNYSASSSGTLTDEGSLSDNFVEATNFPSAGSAIGNFSPTINFDGTDDILSNTTAWSTVIPNGTVFIWCLFYADTAQAEAALHDGNLVADSLNAEIGVDISTSGFSASILDDVLSYTRSGFIPCSVETWHLGLMMCNPSDVGSEGKIAVDDSSWTTWAVPGGFTPFTPGNVTLGKGYEARYFDGRMADVGIVNATASAGNVIKLRKYMQQRYGVTV